MAILDEVILIEELPEESFELVPAGWYEATITATELKDTNNGGGKYIKVRYDIAGPTHQGRCVFGNLNIRNANPKAEEIGRRQLGTLCRCIGINDKLQDTDQLVGNAVQIKVGINQDKTGQYNDQNDVKGFKPIEGSTPILQQEVPKKTAVGAAAAPAAVKGARAPWAK